MALRNVEDRFNRRLKYPYILFMVEGEYDEVTEVQKERIAHITEGRAKFGEFCLGHVTRGHQPSIDIQGHLSAEVPKSQWDAPASLDKSLIEASKTAIGFSHGYRAMCRWYSGFIQVAYDVEWVQRTLASNVSAFMATERENFPHEANHGFVWNGDENVAKAMKGEAGNQEWTKRCMYNNFEISHRSVWENPIYTRFFEFLDRAGGFFYERWSDSPIHSFGLAMTLRKDQVVQFKDMGYQHQGWAFTCPVESSSCTCLQEEEFKSFKDGGEG
ncbi:hypothetical protein DXG01_016166 [Tephrocybe rancida]|nr:hypothetical protein DXG01_016166 [Tephrocybe rancida]